MTGATSGIGRSYAGALASRGYDLLLSGRRAELLERLAAELRAFGGRVELFLGDFAEPETSQRFLEVLGSRPVDFMVNNAGYSVAGALAEADPAALLSLFSVLAELPLRTALAVLPGMVARGAGVVVNVGSLAGRIAVPRAAVYVAAKAFIERLSESVALEAASAGVVVQALVPGYVKTDFHRDTPDYRDRQRSRGLLRWLSPQAVVETSLRAVDAALRRVEAGRIPAPRQIVVIPGRANRFLLALARFTPRGIVHRAAIRPRPM